MYFTYVLYSRTYDQIYVGHTDDLKFRFQKHNSGLVKSTKRYIPWELIYYETFPTRSQAMKREKQLKSHKGRKFIRETLLPANLSSSINPSNLPTELP